MNEPIAYLNGRLLPAASVSISLADAGFILGATVAEQLRTFTGKLFQLNDHLGRLERSLAKIGLEPGMDRRRFAEAAGEVVDHNHRLLDEGDDLGLSIFVTPGPYPSYAGSTPVAPTVCLHTYPLPFGNWANKYHAGQSLVLTGVEQVPATCWPAEIKCRSRMHYYLADREAHRREPGARALLCDRIGHVTEASTANVLVYVPVAGVLSPPHGTVLPGITQEVTDRLAIGLGIPTAHRFLTPPDLAAADEVLLTSTPWCLFPVTRFEGEPIHGGTPGPVFHRLMAAWNELVGLDIAAQAERFSGRT